MLTRLSHRRRGRRNGNGVEPEDAPTPEELREIRAAEFEIVEARLLLELTKEIYRAANSLGVDVQEAAQIIGESMPRGWTLLEATQSFNRGEEW
jgi:hypothetical protein